METVRVTYNPLTPGYFADPYPHYALLREHDPVHVTKSGTVLLTRYEHVREAYEHPALCRDNRSWEGYAEWRRGEPEGSLERMMSNWLQALDPPRHTELRQIHDRVFTQEMMASYGPAIDKIVADLLAKAVNAGGMELVGEFADKIPVYLINHILDLPREDWDQITAWSHALTETAEPMLTKGVLEAGRKALQEIYEYLTPIVEKRAVAPGNDVLSGLASGEVNGRRMSRDELLSSLMFLYQAGHPTGAQQIALAVMTLLNHPDQLALLRANPALLDTAIEELHRYDGPVQMNDRVAAEEVELFGLQLRQGQLVRLVLASANRDPDHYPNGESLDITRVLDVTGPWPQHFGYGYGLHYCIGTLLGQLQIQSGIRQLLAVAPNLRATGAKLRFRPSASNRGLVAFPVEF